MRLVDSALEGEVLKGAYEVESKLGKGGMAWVYKGQHLHLGGPVAIKVLSSLVASEAHSRMRFLREARIQYRLQHPGIVRVLDVLEEGEFCAIMMEWCDGGDLHEWFLNRGRTVEPIHIRMFFLPILDALNFAHHNQVIHRDLKPKNILLSSTLGGMVPKLTDFGIAKALEEESHTETGATIGTLRYISPEQLADSKHIDHRSDIYSFGAMLYMMTTGRHAFAGSGPLVLHQILKEEPPPPREAPLPLQSVIMQCMAKDPNLRFSTCQEVKAALLEALAYLDPGLAEIHFSDLPTPAPAAFASPSPSGGHPMPGSSVVPSGVSFEQAGPLIPQSTPMGMQALESVGEDPQTEVSEPRLLAPTKALPLEDSSVQAGPAPEKTEGSPRFWQLLSLLLLFGLGAALAWVWVHQKAAPKPRAEGRSAVSRQLSARPAKRRPLAKRPVARKLAKARYVPSPARPRAPKPTPPTLHKARKRRAARRKARTSRRRSFVRVRKRRWARRRARRRRTRRRRPRRRAQRARSARLLPSPARPIAPHKVFGVVPVSMNSVRRGLLRLYHSYPPIKPHARRILKRYCLKRKFGGACGSYGHLFRKSKPDVAFRYFKLACRYDDQHTCVHLGFFYLGRYHYNRKFRDPTKACISFHRSCMLSSSWGCRWYNRERCGDQPISVPGIRRDRTHRVDKRYKKPRPERISALLMGTIAQMQYGYTRYKKYIPLHLKACALGYGKSCWHAGVHYLYTGKDKPRAYELFRRSCSLLYYEGCMRAGWMEEGLHKKYQRFENKTLACLHFRKGCRLKPRHYVCRQMKAGKKAFCR